MYIYVIHDLGSWGHTTQSTVYQPVRDFTYCQVLGSFKKWNIIKISHKNKSSEEFEEIHKVVHDGISDNMAYLDQKMDYGAINKKYPKTMGYYVVKYVWYAYKLQEDTTCDGEIGKDGKLFVKA